MTVLIAYLFFKLNPPRQITVEERTYAFGLAVFFASIVIEMIVLIFAIPSYVARSIAEERQKDTLGMLLLTRLTPFEIVLTKWAGRWLSVINLVFVGLPFILAGGWFAGLIREGLLAVLTVISSAGFMAALAILCSAQREQVATASAQAMGWNFGWLFAPPALAALPYTPGTLWGELLYLVKNVCMVVGPSSPMWLLIDRSWFTRSGIDGLEGRIAIMIGLQCLFGLVALGLAATRLKARETNPNWADPSRVFDRRAATTRSSGASTSCRPGGAAGRGLPS